MKRQFFTVALKPNRGNRIGKLGEKLHLLCIGLKRCALCKEQKSVKAFNNHASEKDRLQSACKPCQNALSLKNNPMYLCGITFERKIRKLEAQGRLCGICRSPTDFGKNDGNSASTDHCHTTDKFRGILCAKCNRGLGYFNDNPSRLIMAAIYLREFYEANPHLQAQLKDQQTAIFGRG